MLGATALASFGWYVIHTNKEAQGKKHLLTIHGKLGAFVVAGYLAIGLFGAIALNPDWGLLKGNKTVRFAHKVGGRVLTALAWASCVLGFNTIESNIVSQAVFTFPLLIFGLFALL
jgi:hypothetical protein